MSARRGFFRMAAKVGMLFGALFVVTVLLAAIPAHRHNSEILIDPALRRLAGRTREFPGSVRDARYRKL